MNRNLVGSTYGSFGIKLSQTRMKGERQAQPTEPLFFYWLIILYNFYFNINLSFCRMCPIFQVSNVTGENLNLLQTFMNLLSTRLKSFPAAPAEFQIDDTFSVPVSRFSLQGKIPYL